MNSNSPTPLKRCPSNVSDISGISSFSLASKTPKNLYSDYQVGDYVYVDSISGVKYGVIRYAGYVDFAKGYWFGIELSEANGKNNGTIKGKSYFICAENHGIFTQSSKISKSPPIKKTHRMSGATGSTFGSRESLSSSIYMKRNGLNTSQESLRSCVSGVSAITGVFKAPSKSLKNQLLKAKHLETDGSPKTSCDKVDHLREELSYLSVSESEQLVKSKIELGNQKRELEEQLKASNDEVGELKIAVVEEKRLAKELVNQLEEQKKKMEMLEFQMEEEKIARMQLEEEMQKKAKLIDELKRKSEEAASIKNDENEIELFELQEDLIKKEEKILQLESTLKTRQNENFNLQERTREFEAAIKVFEQTQKNYLTKIDDLNLKLSKYEHEKVQLQDALASSTQEKEGNLIGVKNELAIKSKELDEIKDQLNKKSNDIVMLKDELERTNKRCVAVEQEKNSLKNDRESLAKKIDILESDRRENEELVCKSKSEHSEENRKLIEQLEDYKKKIEQLLSIEKKFKECSQINEENINRLNQELASNRSKIELSQTELRTLVAANEQKESELIKLRTECQRLVDKNEKNQSEKQELENELDNLKSRLEQRESDVHNFEKKKLQYQNELETLMRELSNEKNKICELSISRNEQNAEQKTLLNNANAELNSIREENKKMNLELIEKSNLVNKLQAELNSLDSNAKVLEKSNDELRRSFKKREQRNQDEMNSLRNEHSTVMNEVERKLVVYEESLKKLEEGLVEKDFQINSLQLEHQQKVEQLRLDSSSKCIELEQQITNLNTELASVHRKLVANESKVEENKTAAAKQDNQTNDDVKDFYESQIKFLNSVIVDMQTQNDELKSKVKMLEEIRLEDMIYSPMIQNVDHHQSDSAHPFSFRPTKEQMANQSNWKSSRPPQRTVRLFCSYCDKFDLHDTDDCTLNAKNKQEEAQHTRLNQSKNQSRAYCVNCEVFSHWTYDCPNSTRGVS